MAPHPEVSTAYTSYVLGLMAKIAGRLGCDSDAREFQTYSDGILFLLNSWRVSDYTTQYRRTESVGKRQILTPDEVMRLAPDEEIIELRGQDVLKAEKFDYTEHEDAKLLSFANPMDHIPAWKRNLTFPHRLSLRKRDSPNPKA